MRYGQALCTCADCGCQWWDDSEEQMKDKLRDREDREMEAEARAAEADAMLDDEGIREVLIV